MALPADAVDAWVLFYRAVLGLEPRAALEVAEPYGLMRSRAVVSDNRSVRITLNASAGRASAMARALTAFGGAGVHHVAFACDDIFATVAHLREAGVGFLAAPENYYDDLETRFVDRADLIARLRTDGILYDRTVAGELFHVPTETYVGRFSFEIVQRVGGYDDHGEANAPAYLASQERSPGAG